MATKKIRLVGASFGPTEKQIDESVKDYLSNPINGCEVGCTGFYWFNLDIENNTFTLSTSQLEDIPPENIPWEVGDVISMSDDSTYYTNCATITAIADKTITVDEIPESITDTRSGLTDLTHVYVVDFAVWVLAKPDSGKLDFCQGAEVSGVDTTARGFGASASGYLTVANAPFANAEGLRTTALGARSHAEGSDTQALSEADHAEGYDTKAEGGTSHAEGNGSHAEGRGSHAEGGLTHSVGVQSHAEGYMSKSIGMYSHAEGCKTEANGDNSHTEGSETKTTGKHSHAEGFKSHAKGSASHAEGNTTYAGAAYSHTEGNGTQATGEAQHVQGRFNKADKSLAHIVGNGTDADHRSNAHTLDWDGNAWFAGTVEATAIVLTSPNGTKFKITVNDDGTLSTAAV